jgi:hypothetical protein
VGTAAAVGGRMQAHLMGMIWELGNGISLDQFIAHLATLKDVPVKFNSYDRLLYVGDKGDYYLGLFLTVKDQRKFCEIQQDGGEFTITVRSLEERSNLMDFNFFIVNKNTGRGIYQHYHQSCSANQFGVFLQRQYDDLKEFKKEMELQGVGGDEAPRKEKKRVDARYKGTFKLVVMVRKEKLEQSCRTWRRSTSSTSSWRH